MITFSERQTQEKTYLLKDGRLYALAQLTAAPISPKEALAKGGRFALLIDDSYFFYVYIGKIGTTRKKANAVVANYLQSMFPLDMFAGFALLEDKGNYIALLYKEEFAELLAAEPSFFRAARKISTVLCEAFVRHESFVYTDNTRVYAKRDGLLEAVPSAPAEALRASDLQDDILPIKCDIELAGLRNSADTSTLRKLAIYAAICYCFFLGAQISGIMTDKKLVSSYEAELNAYYVQAGVADTADPYGMLRSRSQSSDAVPFRVLNILNELGLAIDENVKLDAMTINERIVRIEGLTKDFAEMEQLQAALESRLGKTITVEDSRQVDDGRIKFSFRYEP